MPARFRASWCLRALARARFHWFLFPATHVHVFFLQERVHGTCSKRLLWNLIRLKSVGFRSATECCLCKACTELKKDWAAAVDLLTNEHTAMVQSELDVHIKVDNWILFSMWIRPSPSSAPWMALPKLGRRAMISDIDFIERSWKSQKLQVALWKEPSHGLNKKSERTTSTNIALQKAKSTGDSGIGLGLLQKIAVCQKKSGQTTSELQGEHIATR